MLDLLPPIQVFLIMNVYIRFAISVNFPETTRAINRIFDSSVRMILEIILDGRMIKKEKKIMLERVNVGDLLLQAFNHVYSVWYISQPETTGSHKPDS